MPKQDKNEPFDLDSLSTGYDPVAAQEEAMGQKGQELPDDETVSTVSTEGEGDDDPPTKPDDKGDKGGDKGDPPADKDDDSAKKDDDDPDADNPDKKGEGDGDGDDPDPNKKSEKDDPIIPDEDPEVVRTHIKQKTQDRIRGLLSKNKELNDKLQGYDQRIRELEQGGASRQDAKDQASEEMELDLTFDDDKIKEMFDKAVDGDYDTAGKTFTEIIRSVAKESAKAARDQTTQAVTHEQQLNQMVEYAEKLTTDYSILDPQSSDFDEALATDVRDLRDFYISQKRMPYAQALEKAAKQELTVRGLWEKEDTLNDPPAKPDGKKAETDKAAHERNKKAAADKAKVDQPPGPSGKGERAGEPTKKSVVDMSDEEFDKLTDKELTEMFGTQFE